MSGRKVAYTCRPDPARAIFLQGTIDRQLVARLEPQIVQLQHASRDPISIFIHSPGGNIANATEILALLRCVDQDGRAPCKTITVVTTYAASAAANLLTAGEYAIAYPNAYLHFHGVRMYRDDAITVEKAADAARDLKANNHQAALSLARNCRSKFFFRYVSVRSELDRFRVAGSSTSEKDAFVALLRDRLSPLGRQVLDKAEQRNEKYEKLSAAILKSRAMDNLFGSLKNAQPNQFSKYYRKIEAEMIKSIVSFELQRNAKDPAWSFSGTGMTQVNDDFILFNEYLGQHSDDWIVAFAEIWWHFLLSEEQKRDVSAISEDEARKAAIAAKLTPTLLPLWLFLGSICYVLQEEENPLRPMDAFWLGLIDEVVGEKVPTVRDVLEWSPSPQDNSHERTAPGS